nr:Chain F, Beclin-1 [Homo sapiens]6HOI_G Chain G, Beclin-1 [Homo sapiens]
SANSFTLIGE